MTRADKKLDPCDEKCNYNSTGKCSFGIRTLGCFNDRTSVARCMAINGGVKDINEGNK